MVHTFELSKMISKEMFESIAHALNMKWDKYCYFSTNYKEQGISSIRLCKFKRREFNNVDLTDDDTDITHHYMIILVINPGRMFGGEGYLAMGISNFKPTFIHSIYDSIFRIIPQLKIPNDSLPFKLRRIDFTFDIDAYQYYNIIKQGYTINRNSFKQYFYENDKTLADVADNEPDIEDEETEQSVTTVGSIYYKSKSLNINIYEKGKQLKKDNLISMDNSNYDVLRIEFQVKKSKLNALVAKFGLYGRYLECLATPDVEEYVLTHYTKALTATGTYVTYSTAKRIIDNSSYTSTKKNKLKKLINAIMKKHSIAKVLKEIEDGTITDLGKLSTVKTYLCEIQQLGINPVTISTRMEKALPASFVVTDETGTNPSETALPNLVDCIKEYSKITAKEQAQGMTPTDDDLKSIDKVGWND